MEFVYLRFDQNFVSMVRGGVRSAPARYPCVIRVVQVSLCPSVCHKWCALAPSFHCISIARCRIGAQLDGAEGDGGLVLYETVGGTPTLSPLRPYPFRSAVTRSGTARRHHPVRSSPSHKSSGFPQISRSLFVSPGNNLIYKIDPHGDVDVGSGLVLIGG